MKKPITITDIKFQWKGPHDDGVYDITIKGRVDVKVMDGLMSNTGDSWMVRGRVYDHALDETLLMAIRFKEKKWILPARRRHSSKIKDRMPSMLVVAQRQFAEA